MSYKLNDGGPAFPMSISNGGYSIITGMSLRDWFAGQALAQIWMYSARLTDPVAAKLLAAAPNAQALKEVVSSPDFKVFDSAVNDAIVGEAYRVADAMLAARNGGAK